MEASTAKPSKLQAWYQASRPPFFIATVLPLGMGAALAGRDGYTNWLVFAAIFLASFFVHTCTNLANDYFDSLAGADSGDSVGGSRVIQQGKLSLAELGWAMVVLYTIAGLLGIWLVLTTQVWWLIAVMAFSFLSSLYYSAPPIRYGWRALGEVLVFINMGPVMVGGTYAALTGSLPWEVVWLSLPFGLHVALILFYQALPDIETDRAVGKATIATIMGQPRAILGLRILATAVQLVIVGLSITKLLPWWALLCLFSIPLALKVDRLIRSTEHWQDLHGRGKAIRLYYLVNAIVLIGCVIWG